MQIIISESGAANCVYSEAIDLQSVGTPTIRRGSHVEPNAEGLWIADLSPVSGPQLGPFNCRSQALTAELHWLEENWLPKQA